MLALAPMSLASAVAAAPREVSGLDDASLAEALKTATDRAEPQYCDELAPLWKETLRRAAPPAPQAMLESGSADLWCAISEKRYQDASAAIRLTESKLGRQPRFDRIALSLNAYMLELETAVARVDQIAQADGGEGLVTIPPDVIYEISRKLVAAKRSDLKLALWSSIYAARSFNRLDRDIVGGTGINLLQGKADAGLLSDKDGDLADMVTNASAYSALLAQKRYAPLWPHLEARAGDNLAEILALDRDITASRLKEEPRMTRRFADAIYSMLQSGEHELLVKATEAFRDDGTDYDEIDEQIAWGINSMAIALRASGQPDEGLKALDRLASLDPERHSWVVNFAINHAAALAGETRHEEALKSYERALPIAQKQGSPYARAIITGQRACSLQALGRTAEAAAALKVLEDTRADAPSRSIEFAICAGREDLAIAWALEALADETHRWSAVATLQPRYMDDTPEAWNDPEPHLLLAKSPELAAAFNTVARVVPERFAPLGGKSRTGPKPADAPAS
jgi:tetratricopeptide (TPR) repeat protein